MKRTFRLLAILSLCLAFGYLFNSCKSSHDHDDFAGKTGQPIHGKIHVTYDANDKSLVLLDDKRQNAVYVVVKKLDKIDWKVDDTNVEIDSIYIDPYYATSINPNFFVVKLSGNSTNWSAQVGDPDPTKLFFKYVIKWHLTSAPNTPNYFDPIMQLNPK